jgi:hypothetical protein
VIVLLRPADVARMSWSARRRRLHALAAIVQAEQAARRDAKEAESREQAHRRAYLRTVRMPGRAA